VQRGGHTWWWSHCVVAVTPRGGGGHTQLCGGGHTVQWRSQTAQWWSRWRRSARHSQACSASVLAAGTRLWAWVPCLPVGDTHYHNALIPAPPTFQKYPALNRPSVVNPG
jgi:hypothetical protein